MDNGIAVVTGAASGIGASVARALGKLGVTVAAVDSDADTLRRTTEKLTADGLHAVGYAADVADRAEVEAMAEAVERDLGPVDHLVNCAGILRLGRVLDLTRDDWAASLAVNTTGVFNTSQALVRRMVPRSRGAVVTVVSNAATTPRMDMAAYAASKAAAAAFTKCLGLEVAGYGIRCNMVAPGSTDTPMLRSMWTGETGPQTTIDGRPEAYRLGIPLRRLARPDDIAEAVLFLLSERAAHITMHTLTVDGGATLGT
ncbi:2,3-dihydro-2,3-dihydroxybenzoate dehydrogenase [Microtetraspora sp. NBRC 13810]|uniref:2,3-dihydro-2,3-dihydroxybenzoate dehydrogenase n=1 Tax=Microtetraspora sp. NBRC 13810 TaxID=3030990 RepID=UPI0024A328F4|nr:2,3-dihydro-2,3-dihydroxybenzoate dehydrogenase [Microtetraspora sp. NBRC 13810]GLW09396.1 2,3-dihydro-2,3-dihydroxybenzoate dehydrogenase [Microtetraspora sp. NBRC 13810]